MTALITTLSALPEAWVLTPVNGKKAPYTNDWQKISVTREAIAQEIENGKAQGFGILTGKLSGGIMAIDCDGHIPHALFKEILGGDIPLTVAFTSGKDGRAQYLFAIPQAHWASISTKKAGTAKDGGMLEFRWDGCQSVLPPSVHPETGAYKWIDSPDTTAIAPLPDAVLTYLLTPKQHPEPLPNEPQPQPVFTTGYIPPIPIERCLSKEHRAALENGVSEGNRDDMGCSLARDLIGVASYVPSIQFDYQSSQYQLPVDGDPAQLLWDYCQRCSPPLSQADCDRIYKSALGYNPAPSISDEDSLKNCLRAWCKEHKLAVQNSSSNGSSNGNGSSHGVHDKPQYSQFDSNITDGLFKNNVKVDPDTGEFKLVRERIGNHLEAIAYVNNPNGDGAAIHIEFKTIRHKIKRWTMPRGAIVCETSQMLAELQNRGYFFDISKKKQLVEYLNALGGDVATTYTITDTTGWIDGAYVTQNKTYSLNRDSDLKFRDVEPIADSISEIKGTLAEWQDQVGSHCAGNSRLIFALGTGLAAPLQPLVDVESGGFHVVGTTSVGKTTMLRVGSSVVGIKDIPHWRTTTNGLESIACAHNHMLLPLDEIGQAEPREVGAIAYMLANGQGKTRMTKNLTNRKPKTWQLLFLSSGELGMGAYMAQSGIALKGGQEVRLPDIPAVPSGSPFGVFESIHNFESAKQFAEHLDRATQTYHGTLLDAFLPKLVTDRATNPAFASTLKKQVYAIARKLSEGTIDTAVARVANRFALVQVALELAHAYGLLPFPLAHIGWAISKMFRDWLDYRGGDGSIEVKNACDRIRSLFVSNQHGDRIFDVTENHRLVRNLLAYCKSTKDSTTNVVAAIDEFWVPGTIFEKELCSGVDKTVLVLELQQRGWLIPPRNDGKAMHTRTCNGKRSYFYIFNPDKILDCAESEKEGVQGVQGVQEASKTIPVWDTPSLVPVHHPENTGVQGVQLISQLDGNEQACTPCTPLENLPCTPNLKNEILSHNGFTPLSTPCTPCTPEKTHLNNLKIEEQNFFDENSYESGKSVNGSDSLDSPRLTKAVSQNGNSQILSQPPVQTSGSPDSPDSLAKMPSQKIVDNYLSPPIKKGDKVMVQTSNAVGVVMDDRIKNHRSPKKGVVMVGQYLVEFEEGERKWLDAEILALDKRN
jgi:Domain of unknown function (DUF927)/Bifunctional DNA primase/polymerase, N-terminal